MAFVLIENKVVVQKQLDKADGFILVSDEVVCGQVQQTDGSFANPKPKLDSELSPAELRQKHLNEIQALENSITPRLMREALNNGTYAKNKIAEIEKAIELIRGTL